MKVFAHHAVRPIADLIRQGGVLVFPTDTVWGIGGNGLDANVAARVIAVKGKPAGAKLIWLLPSVRAVTKYCGTLSPTTKKLLNQKHTTVIVRGQAVRVVKHGWVNRLLQAAGVPVIASSANRHGQPTITAWRQAAAVFGEQIDAVVKGRKVYHTAPSTVVALDEHDQPQIIRPGGGIDIK